MDVLAFFYAPWCAFCKSAEPVFYEIAGLLGDPEGSYSAKDMNVSYNSNSVDDTAPATDGGGGDGIESFSYLSVVQIDATRNEVDHPTLKIVGFPSIQLFRRGQSVSPVEYEGEYTTNDLLTFLSVNRVLN